MQRPSRAQLNQILGRVNAKINVIDQISEFYTSASTDPSYSYLNHTFAKIQQQLPAKVQKYLTAQLKCMNYSMSHPNDSASHSICDDYEHNSEELLQSLSDEAVAMADRDDYMLNPRNKDDYVKYLNSQKAELIGQRERLYTMLGEMDPLTGGILDADQLAIANLSDTYKDDNWLQFSFDYDSMDEQTEESSSYELTTVSGGVNFLFFHIGGSHTHSKQT